MLLPSLHKLKTVFQIKKYINKFKQFLNNFFSCAPPILLPFICRFSLKALNLSLLHRQKLQTIQSYGYFWVLAWTKESSLWISVLHRLSDGMLSRAKIISPSFVLCKSCSVLSLDRQGLFCSSEAPGDRAMTCDCSHSSGREWGELIRFEPWLYFLDSGIWCGSKDICLAFSVATFLVLT